LSKSHKVFTLNSLFLTSTLPARM